MNSKKNGAQLKREAQEFQGAIQGGKVKWHKERNPMKNLKTKRRKRK